VTSFLSAVYKTTLYFEQDKFTKIINKERHYFCSRKGGLNVGDVVLIEPKDSDSHIHKTTLELLITGKDSTPELTVYGFVSVEDIPKALHDLVSGIYEANHDLVEQVQDLQSQVLNLLSINENRKAA
jgi:hypothetical protein